MFLFLQLVMLAITCAIIAGLFCPAEDGWVRRIMRGLLPGILAQAIELGVLIFHFRWIHLYSGQLSFSLLLGYFVIGLALTFVLAVLQGLMVGALTLAKPLKKFHWSQALFVILMAVLALAVAILFFGSKWFNGYLGWVTPDQLIFTLTTAGDSATGDVADELLSFIKLPAIFCVLMAIFVGMWHTDILVKCPCKKHKLAASTAGTASDTAVSGSNFVADEAAPEHLAAPAPHVIRIKSWAVHLFSFLCAVILVVVGFFYANTKVPLFSAIYYQMHSSRLVDDNYVEPTEANLVFPEKPRNLIHIYMESIENSYYDREHGGYMEQNLMPDLMKLNLENTSFSNTDKLGGPHQVNGAYHSVAAMMNFGCGVPQKTGPFSDFPTIGDILYAHGYQNSFIMGADASWGSLDQYYKTHGNFKVQDHRTAIADGRIPPDYKVWWGYEDDKLYEYAKEEMTRLASDGRPFYFIIENADTHFPDGYVSPLMKEKPFDVQYANVIYYSQRETVKLVDWIKSQPWYKDTTIVITGDHRSHEKKFFEGWDPNYERTIVNMFINDVPETPGPELTKNRNFASFDIFPTTLAAIGVQIKGNHLGLGTNLYSNEKTLLDKMTVQQFDEEISKRSDLYQTYRRPKIWLSENGYSVVGTENTNPGLYYAN